MHKNHGVKWGSPKEALLGFQIRLGNAGLSDGKLISFFKKLIYF